MGFFCLFVSTFSQHDAKEMKDICFPYRILHFQQWFSARSYNITFKSLAFFAACMLPPIDCST